MGFGGDRRGFVDVGAIGEIFGVYGLVLTEGDPPMALPQSAVSGLLGVLRTSEAVDLIRESVRMVLQELVEAEASEVIGAARYERTDSRTNERNGSRPRTLSTKAGDIDLRIPKLRKGSFFPLILEPRRRIDQAPGRERERGAACSACSWVHPRWDGRGARAPSPSGCSAPARATLIDYVGHARESP